MAIDPQIAAGRSSYLLASVVREFGIWKVAGSEKNTEQRIA